VFTLSPDAAEDALLHRVEPVYPEEARQQGIQGSVVLDLHIGKDGAVQRVDLISGPALLAEASTAAVKQWQFKPHSVGGNQVEMQTRTTLSFTLPTL
jgi:protein TonB